MLAPSAPSAAANASTVAAASLAARPGTGRRLAGLARELLSRHWALAINGLLLWALVLPAAVALAIDDRTLRDVNVWVKPIKFMLSLGLYSLTMAWLIGWIAPARRGARPVAVAAWTVIVASWLELGYITLQAARGVGSHYNLSDLLHTALYAAMGVTAIALTAACLPIARALRRHGAADVPEVARLAAAQGLVLTFTLGAGAGMLLSGLQPPSGPGVATVPILGWALAGDLRIAHFIGMHAQQVMPLAGLAIAASGSSDPARKRGALRLVVGAYALLAVAALAWGLATRAY